MCRSRQLDVAGTVYAAGRTTVTSKSNGILALVKYTANGALSFGDLSASGSGSTGYAPLDLYGGAASKQYLPDHDDGQYRSFEVAPGGERTNTSGSSDFSVTTLMLGSG